MSITIAEATDAFELFYRKILDRDFRKTLRFHEYGESELLPLARAFLLGRFGEALRVEVECALPGAASGYGRLDFCIGDIATEFAVSKPQSPKATLSRYVNATEVKKLAKYNDGPALLVLFDFSRRPYGARDLDQFRQWPSLGKGNFSLSSFNVRYFNRGAGKTHAPDCISKNVRFW